MLNADGYINAIKTIRRLGHNKWEMTATSNGAVTFEPLENFSLKDAKDFIDAVMAMGAARARAEEQR